MALANYSDLQTAVTTWMKRSALSGEAADFIALAEGEIRRKFHGVAFVHDATLTGTVDSRILSTGFPSDYEKPIALYLTTWVDHDKLTPVMTGTFPYAGYSGTPKAWTVKSDGSGAYRIELDKPCDQAHTFRFVYRQKLDIANSSTNWLLTNYPDVYLTGALHWATKYAFRGDTSRLTWERDFMRAIDEVETTEAEHDSIGQALVDPMFVAEIGAFNINSPD